MAGLVLRGLGRWWAPGIAARALPASTTCGRLTASVTSDVKPAGAGYDGAHVAARELAAAAR